MFCLKILAAVISKLPEASRVKFMALINLLPLNYDNFRCHKKILMKTSFWGLNGEIGRLRRQKSLYVKKIF